MIGRTHPPSLKVKTLLENDLKLKMIEEQQRELLPQFFRSVLLTMLRYFRF